MQSKHFSRKFLYDILNKYLDVNFKVQDARKAFRVITKVTDCVAAVPLDPFNCVFGKACQRVKHPALVYRTVAYVVRSRKLVEKYQLDGNARATILANDMVTGEHRKGLIGLAGVVLHLKPPSGQRKVATRSHNRKKGLPSRSGKKLALEAVVARQSTINLLKPWSRLFQL